MSGQWSVDGEPGTLLPVDDRGLAYGDGVFETVRVNRGVAVWGTQHLARLAAGCAALEIHLPGLGALESELAGMAAQLGEGIVKLIVTRGGGARGYRPDPDARARRIASAHGLPMPSTRPLVVDIAQLRLSVQPRLAGLKHLNRIEQVLAARECATRGLDEAILADTDGHATSGVATNLFWRRDGHWHTPAVDRAGVAGVCRAWILERRPDTRIVHAPVDELAGAEALFLCNSVRGILPVARMGPRALPIGPHTRALMSELHDFCPAFHPAQGAAT
ncbi:MAG TPA: aminodeoxychorismate lyase [Xanthomonadaceae bacterium]|nr:aminodeoxychorismate lyase [Xanthomonadaceae bacterium]